MRRLLVPFFALASLGGCSCDSTPTADDDRDVAVLDGAFPDTPVPDAGPPPNVHVVLTGDNAYGFGYGPPGRLSNYNEGLEATVASEIFGCSRVCTVDEDCDVGGCDAFGTCNADNVGAETYVVPGADTVAGDFLYVIAWSDNRVTQGLLGTFIADGATTGISTGDAGWEVCATGMDFDPPSGGPDRATIDAEISACDGGGGISAGWIDSAGRGTMALVVGEANDEGTGGDFPGVCTDATRGDSVPQTARWMWFDRDTADAGSPFRAPDSGEFLIFRLAVRDVIELI